MSRIKANALRKGDVIGIVAPASPPRDAERITKSIAYLEGCGYRIELGKHVVPQSSLPSPTYLAASDKDRTAAIHAMFRNKHVKAILYHRGGYGSIRLLDMLDYDLIRRNPKIMVGYSDATALFAAVHKMTGLASCFFGPMPGVDLWNTIDPFAEEMFWRALTSSKPLGILPVGAEEATVMRKADIVEGKLAGGNLTVLNSLLGTPYQPKLKSRIWLLEEIEEKPRRIDAYFAQLKLAGAFDSAKAVLLGYFSGCDEDKDAPSLTLKEVIDHYFGKLSVPVISALPFGHEPRMWTVPLGARARVSTTKGLATIEIVDTALD